MLVVADHEQSCAIGQPAVRVVHITFKAGHEPEHLARMLAVPSSRRAVGSYILRVIVFPGEQPRVNVNYEVLVGTDEADVDRYLNQVARRYMQIHQA
jgi:hypothetical protein